ncbi:MAG: homoserine O-acetyltransferase [Pseudomonadota bacterium]
MLSADGIAALISPATQWFSLPGPLRLDSGAELVGGQLAYRTWGQLAADGRNAVLVCHALTGSADVDTWWPGLIGAGLALDPANDFIVCSNVLGSCYGSSGPLSRRPGSDALYGGEFPRLTIRDIIRAQRKLIDALGIRQLRLVIGPSLGGMQTLEWAATYPELVSAIAPIGVSGRHSAWCIATSEAQRQAIFADPNWQGGRYSPAQAPERGLAAARMMAMVSYRSWANFESRFGRSLQPDSDAHDFQVQSYLAHQGRRINERFDAVSYVRLTESMDTHDIARGRGDYPAVLAALTMPALVVSVPSDVLYPPHEQQILAQHLPAAELVELDSEHGHDGFLIATDALSAEIRRWRATFDRGLAATGANAR